MRRAARLRAFTILEVLMASGVLAIAILGLIAALTTTSSLRQTTDESNLAVQLVDYQVEHFRSLDLDAVNTDLANTVTTVGDYTVTGTQADYTVVGGRLNGARVQSEILSESDASYIYMLRDLDGSGTYGDGTGDAYDFDADSTPGEVDADSDRTAYTVIPMRVWIVWQPSSGSGTGTVTHTTVTVLYPTKTS